jgi:hypothetical protein
MKIVTVTCDAQHDVAPAFLAFLHLNWPDCPYEVVFLTRQKKLAVDAPVHYLNARGDVSYGWRLREFLLHSYTDDLILLMMADYLIKSANTPLIAKAEALCRHSGVRHVRLRPMPHPPKPYESDPDFGVIDKRARYSLSLQPGIWESQTIFDLLKPRESAHHTETLGSSRVKHVKGLFLSVRRAAIYHHNYYKHGKAWGFSLVADSIPMESWPDGVRKWWATEKKW